VIANNSRVYEFGNKDESIEQYIEWRGWNIEHILRDHGVDENKQLIDDAIGLLSHPLTFPLTLARHWQKLCNSSSSHNKNFRLCCVGARAECTLPDEYWRELLIATSAIDNKDDDAQVTIDFIGPDVPAQLKSKTITLDNNFDEDTTQPSGRQLTMNFHSSFLHEAVLKIIKSQQIKTDQIKNVWDAFVLFNPGLGHPHLAKQWLPTLKFLIRTTNPILFTAHSTIDAERDRLVLEQLLSVDRNNGSNQSIKYEPNPCASRLEFVDPFSKEHVHIVRPNHSCFLLK
jgi:splicing suppressor protein 51